MDTIRAALGEPKISYFGFSYGSELGATWMTMFPDTVRAAVLDGAVDPTAGLEAGNVVQAAGFEHTFADFLSACSSDTKCAFHSDGDAAGAFEALMAQVDQQPIPTEPGRAKVNLQMLVSATSEAMYYEWRWPILSDALAAAQGGDGRGLMALYDEYYMRRADGSYANTLEAFETIMCMDHVDRPTVADSDALAAQLRAVSPHLNPNTSGSYECTFFPPAVDPRIPITGLGAGPVLVVGTTGDPATPLASSQAMADALDEGVLLTVVADQHTGYGANQCSFDVVDNYLIDRTVPPVGSRCE
jgi:pimeloyl-ACP methyl ester carboxylesterase